MADDALAGAQTKAEAEGRTIVWGDEAGFSLLPARVRTDALRGQTPILRVPLTREQLSTIGALTADERVLVQVQDEAVRGPRVVCFLRQLLRHSPGKLLVIWDGSPLHRCQAVKAFLRQGGAARLWLERLPSYAPELNPVDLLWSYLIPMRILRYTRRTVGKEQYDGAGNARDQPFVDC